MQRRFSQQAQVSLVLLVLSALTAFNPVRRQAQQRTTPRVIALDEAIALAVQHSPQIKEEQFGVLLRQSQQAQANAARFAQLEIVAVGGPSPRARGNQVSSPDSKHDPDI